MLEMQAETHAVRRVKCLLLFFYFNQSGRVDNFSNTAQYKT
jgi:hypothetical protein